MNFAPALAPRFFSQSAENTSVTEDETSAVALLRSQLRLASEEAEAAIAASSSGLLVDSCGAVSFDIAFAAYETLMSNLNSARQKAATIRVRATSLCRRCRCPRDGCSSGHADRAWDSIFISAAR